MRLPLLSLVSLAVLLLLPTMAEANHTLLGARLISFVKEVTLSLQPPDMAELAALSPEDHAQAEDFLASSLRLLDPIMRFFESMVGIQEPVQPNSPA
jgi:hypothetical protein